MGDAELSGACEWWEDMLREVGKTGLPGAGRQAVFLETGKGICSDFLAAVDVLGGGCITL